MNNKTMAYMPYVNLKEPLITKKFVICPVDKILSETKLDKETKDYIQSIAESYTSMKGHKVKGQAVVLNRGYKITKLQQRSREAISKLTNVIFLSSIIKNYQYSFTTSENFQIVYYNFTKSSKNKSIALEGGGMFRVTKFGNNITDLKHITPDYVYVDPSHQISYDEGVFKKLINREEQNILPSIKEFFFTFQNNNFLEKNTRILSLVRACELLFKGKVQNAFSFSQLIENKTINQYSTKKERSYTIKKCNKNIRVKWTITKIEMYRLYKLRNKIIHGKKIKKEDYLSIDKKEELFFIGVNAFYTSLLNTVKPELYSLEGKYSIKKDIAEIKDKRFKIQDNQLVQRILNSTQ